MQKTVSTIVPITVLTYIGRGVYYCRNKTRKSEIRMKKLLTYCDAEAEMKTVDNYKSADYYRTQISGELVLALRDLDEQILSDVFNFGKGMSRAIFDAMLDQGALIEIKNDEGVICGHKLSSDWDTDDNFFKHHMAMQCAFPELYMKFFGGELVWDKEDSRVKDLINLCISCLTNNDHPTDFYGYHEKVKPGNTKDLDKKFAHANWVKDCQKRKEAIKNAWDEIKHERLLFNQYKINKQSKLKSDLLDLKNEYLRKKNQLEDDYANDLLEKTAVMTQLQIKHKSLKNSEVPDFTKY